MGVRIPNFWRQVDPRVRVVVVAALCRKYPLLQLCDDNYKANFLMVQVWYDKIKCKRDKGKKANTTSATLHGALYRFDDDDDNNDVVKDSATYLMTRSFRTTTLTPLQMLTFATIASPRLSLQRTQSGERNVPHK